MITSIYRFEDAQAPLPPTISSTALLTPGSGETLIRDLQTAQAESAQAVYLKHWSTLIIFIIQDWSDMSSVHPA